MEEKIKVSLPKSVLTTLKNDCKNFLILKDDDTPNFNLFINTLINNYYEDFTATEELLHDEIKKTLDIIPDRYKESTFNDIVKIIAKKDQNVVDDESTTFSFKPTRLAEKAITFIESILLTNESLSSFYRRLFISYISKTQPQREKIIFKENYNLLQKALKKGVQVCVVTKSDSIKSTSVYGIFSAKEELFNYVLSTDGFTLYTIRLAKIKDVTLLSKKIEIPQDICDIFARQVRCGVQYPIFREEDKPIKVKFTKTGKFLFKRIYLYRPVPISIDKDIYTFDCSTNQAMHYFKRFGCDAMIIEPKNIANMMCDYYSVATKKYNDYLNINKTKQNKR